MYYIHDILWDEITYLFLNVNGATDWCEQEKGSRDDNCVS